MRLSRLAVALALLLAGCATSSKVVPSDEQDTYKVNSPKARATVDAREYCQKKHRVMVVRKETEEGQDYVLIFACVPPENAGS